VWTAPASRGVAAAWAAIAYASRDRALKGEQCDIIAWCVDIVTRASSEDDNF